jgi:hypothetical protein
MVGVGLPGETQVASVAPDEAVAAMNDRETGLTSLCFIPFA